MYFVAFVLEGERSCSPQECNRQVERQCGGVMPKACTVSEGEAAYLKSATGRWKDRECGGVMPKACTVSEGEAAHLKSKARQRTESVEMQ